MKIRLTIMKSLTTCLIVVLVLFYVGLELAYGVFFEKSNLNDQVTRVIEWKSAAESRRAEFRFPKGYLDQSDSSNFESSGSIHLVLMYPSKKFITSGETSPSIQQVNIYIRSLGANGGRAYTSGDRYKKLIDAGTLKSESNQELVGERDGILLLKTVSRENPKETSVFYDEERKHWISSVQKMDGYFRAADAILKDQTAVVDYRYRPTIEPDPRIIHRWVMEFVENQQINQTDPSTRSK